MKQFLFCLVMVVALNACGQSGPLYLPTTSNPTEPTDHDNAK